LERKTIFTRRGANKEGGNESNWAEKGTLMPLKEGLSVSGGEL